MSFAEKERERSRYVVGWESSDHWSFSYTRLKDFFFGVCLTAFHASRLGTHDSVYRALCARTKSEIHTTTRTKLRQPTRRESLKQITDRMRNMKPLLYTLTVAILFISVTTAQKCDSNGTCDKHERCSAWKEEGECNSNKAYMLKYCPVTCGSSGGDNVGSPCQDVHPRCEAWLEIDDVCSKIKDMPKYCAKSCNACGEDHDSVDNTRIMSLDKLESCVDFHEKCQFWASKGECQNNPDYMLQDCPKSCNSCDKSNLVQELIKIEEEANKVASLSDEDVLEQSAKYGDKQVALGNEKSQTLDNVRSFLQYMESDEVQTLPTKYRDGCRNRNELCSFWAVIGKYMIHTYTHMHTRFVILTRYCF